ncbi:hypothetical protein T210_0136945 [Burkholderia pseudomallei MSHR6137]|nr:hypothetical protein BOC37_14210 [Burkholderia pseudomallei]ARL90805.1 hypothetical protein BOC57_33820 [Burkholderia pseudomallei]EXI98093.1 hypothetical protein T210_0136945 [Burkholderia pseudomallei MSHR6137]
MVLRHETGAVSRRVAADVARSSREALHEGIDSRRLPWPVRAGTRGVTARSRVTFVARHFLAA